MKTVHLSNRGQVLIIFVFAIIGLIGITALAIDGGNLYSDRRHAQNTADAAAMAGALYRVDQEKWHAADPADCGNIPSTPPLGGYGPCASAIITTALNMANTNRYADSTVQVLTPPLDGQYADCSKPNLFDCHDYVEVIIDSHVQPYFAQVLGIRDLENRVVAVALADYTPSDAYYGGMTLVQLNTGRGNCPSDFNVGGGGTVTLDGGGIWVNSTNENCAYKQTSCNTQVIGENGAVIQVVGGVAANGCTATATPPPPPIVTGVSPQYDYTPKHIFPAPPWKPDYCANHTGSTTGSGSTTYLPGDYQGRGAFPFVNSGVTLEPGVYCVDRLVTQKDITGDGVFIYIYPTSNQSQVDMSGGVITMSAITDANSPYAGFLIYGDYDQYSNKDNPPTCTIAGGTNSVYTGMIWIPLCSLVISGNTSSDGESAQIIASDISLSGTMDLTFKYDESKYPKSPEVNNTGLFH